MTINWPIKASTLPGTPSSIYVFLDSAQHALMRGGINLAPATFDELVAVNERNSDTWAPLFPTYHPAFSRLRDGNAICLFGRDQSGDVISTQVARLFDWSLTNYRTEAETLRLVYDDPGRDAAPHEKCIVTAASAERLRGRIAYTGGVWYRPDYRGRGLQAIVARIARALGVVLWNIDFAVANVAEPTIRRGFHQRIGHCHIEWSVNFLNTRLGSFNSALLWMDRGEIVDDLAQFSARQLPQTDSAVKDSVS